MYREFCRFLDKRFVRTFKQNVSTSIDAGVSFSLDPSKHNDSNLRELDNVLVKEASLNYIIRKGAELNLDLR